MREGKRGREREREGERGREGASEERGGDEEEEREEEKPPQQQRRDPSKAKYEPQLVDLLGAGGEGAGEQLLLQRQQHPQPPRPQEVLQSEDCCPCREERAQLPPPLFPRPPSLPPPPPIPPPVQHPSNARPMPEPVGLFCAGDEESKREGVSLPAGARGRAVQNAYWQKSMSGLLKHCARRWLTGGTSPPWKEARERAKVGAGGGSTWLVGDRSTGATGGAAPSERG